MESLTKNQILLRKIGQKVSAKPTHGAKIVAAWLGLTVRSVRQAAADDKWPSGWFEKMHAECAKLGIKIDTSGFAMRRPSVRSGQGENGDRAA